MGKPQYFPLEGESLQMYKFYYDIKMQPNDKKDSPDTLFRGKCDKV